MAGEEVVMREDFLDIYSTFQGDLNIPLGSCEYFGCGGVGCCIRFGVNDRVTIW